MIPQGASIREEVERTCHLSLRKREWWRKTPGHFRDSKFSIEVPARFLFLYISPCSTHSLVWFSVEDALLDFVAERFRRRRARTVNNNCMLTYADNDNGMLTFWCFWKSIFFSKQYFLRCFKYYIIDELWEDSETLFTLCLQDRSRDLTVVLLILANDFSPT